MRRAGRRQVPWLLAVPGVASLRIPLRTDRVRRVLRIHELERADPRALGRPQELPRDLLEPEARGALWHTLELAGCFVVAVNAIGLALALALNRTVKTRHLLRLAVLPAGRDEPARDRVHLAWIFDYQGALNRVLGDVGLGSWRQVWLGDPSTALWTILVVMVWQFSGLAMVLYLAGLQGIPDDVYEATLVDGASGWLRLRKVVLPLLAPAVTVSATSR